MALRDGPPLERGLLTNWLLAQLAADLGSLGTPVLVGDAIAPAAGGWPAQPQTTDTTFAPYTVLTTAQGTPGISGSAREDIDVWTLGYQLRSVGVPRAQADWTGDRARSAWQHLSHGPITLGAATWSIRRAYMRSLGGIQVNRSVDPAVFELTDDVVLLLART